MTAVTLEFHFPANWALENELDVLWRDGSTEMSYGRLAQNRTITQTTYPGHQWTLREAASRELVLSVVAAEQLPGMPQRVTVGVADPTERIVPQIMPGMRGPHGDTHGLCGRCRAGL